MPGINNYAGAILEKSTYSFYYTLDGHRHFVNTRYLPDFNWYLLVDQSDESSVSKLQLTFYANLLISACIAGIVLLVSVRTLNAYQRHIEYLAETDSLTGVANRETFKNAIEFYLESAQKKNTPLCLAIIDIDNFKAINDSYGHLAEDEFLVKLSGFISGHIRQGDFFARWGGEEFVIIFNNCTINKAVEIAERIRKECGSLSLSYSGNFVHLTVSIGIAEYVCGESDTELLKRADTALYNAKTQGKNQVCVV